MHNDLSVDGPNQGSVAMSADLVQKTSPAFRLGGQRRTFGRRGLPWGMRAIGRARRTEPTTPRAEVWIAGTMGVIDAR